mmetsp:Transcript_11485/g.40050  ORF Transcript_11485/g.40050 Transcript_11485/m.40050 type:complete len:506 (-) Transcript_11485:38-1555(-)
MTHAVVHLRIRRPTPVRPGARPSRAGPSALALHRVDEVGERVPVAATEQRRAEAQVREVLDVVPARRRLLDDGVVGRLVVARQRVLARKGDAGAVRGGLRLLHELERPARARRRLLVVLHLHAREVELGAVLGEHGGNVGVGVVAVRVPVPGRQLCGVRRILVPPVNAAHLARHLDAAAQRRRGGRQHAVAVRQQLAGVPAQEEAAVVAHVVVLPAAAEEARVAGVAVVAAGVVGTAMPPLGVAGRRRRGGEVGKGERAVALELADAAEGPARERVGRVPHLAGWAHRHLDALDGRAHVRAHGGRERRHVVAVDLDGRAPAEGGRLVREERDVLVVLVALRVLVPDAVGRGAARPRRQRDVALVADVAAALVEGHHGVVRHAGALYHVRQLLVRREVVRLRRASLAQSPPHVAHDAGHAAARQLLQLRLQAVRVVQLVVAVHHVELQHHVDRDVRGSDGRGGGDCHRCQQATSRHRDGRRVQRRSRPRHGSPRQRVYHARQHAVQ